MPNVLTSIRKDVDEDGDAEGDRKGCRWESGNRNRSKAPKQLLDMRRELELPCFEVHGSENGHDEG